MKPKLRVLLGCLAAFALALPLAASSVTYTYTGNDFQAATGPYTLTDFVSGFFTLAAPLGDNVAFGAITPLSYSFSDQVQTFNSTTPPPNVTFDVATDASGNIDEWEVALQNGGNAVSTISFSSDFGEMGASEGLIIGDPGTWVMSGGGTSPVPEPGNVALMGVSLIGLAMMRRNWKRVAPPKTA